MKSLVFLGLTVVTAIEPEVPEVQLDQYAERSFNDSCNALGIEYFCKNECHETYQQCINDCKNDSDQNSCNTICNRDQTTCVDRCPCHDKCSWGCPCGFYQCDPECPSLIDIEPNRRCADACIRKADNYVGSCIGNPGNTEDECYEEGNRLSIACMEDECPCYDKCPTCADRCSDYCPDEPTNEEKCLETWGDEEEECMDDCDKPRKDCYDACTTAACKDQCDFDYITKEACCHRQCPCHSGCPIGCPCFGDTSCDIGVDGSDYCPNDIDGPDPNCVEENEDIVKRCVQPCFEASYECSKNCQDNDCIQDCQDVQTECTSHCPCYELCPNGCPCPGWCGELPCNTIWPNNRDCCEDKCMKMGQDCSKACSGPEADICRDECLDKFGICFNGCPCHTNCPNGCPCGNYLTEDDIDCCSDVDINPPENENCVILWEEEIEQCRDHCSASTQQCLVACEGDESCRAVCYDNNARCVGQCPCYDECPNGCPCPVFDDFPEFCPTPIIPPGTCTENNKDEIEKCINYCYDNNWECVESCKPGYECVDDCKQDAIECPNDCPCFANCPNGCPCGYSDCEEFNPFMAAVGLGNRFIWCEDAALPDQRPPEWCEILWGDELEDCLDYCMKQQNSCQNGCGNDVLCNEKCEQQRRCCELDCPCRTNCLDGCPCGPGDELGDWCPGLPTDDNCMKDWEQQEKVCVSDCYSGHYSCLAVCEECDCTDEAKVECYNECKDEGYECTQDCPCHRNCINGCDLGECPTWDKYCPATTPAVTQPPATEPVTTTTAAVTTTTADGDTPIAPIDPPITPPKGDTILILADDKAMLHRWPKGSPAYFYELQNSYQDFNSKFDFNGFWVKDSCSVQFLGRNYLIGGAYNCAGGNTDQCSHINVQRSVMMLDPSSCGLEIIWDGYYKKLPNDMKEHSCAVFQKRISSDNYQERVMLCAPDDAADDTNNPDREYIDRKCWSTRYMSTDSMNWEREPKLKHRHIKGAMVHHKGRLVMIGGTGEKNGGDFSQNGSPEVEWLNQNLVINEDGSSGQWRDGKDYPLRVESHTISTTIENIYVIGGLSYDENYDPWDDSAKYNTAAVYRNQDPSSDYDWIRHGELLRPRAVHNTIYMGEQMYHIAGNAKDYFTDPNNPVVNGRRIEKWENTSNSANKLESEDLLFKYISPQSFIVEDTWYLKCQGATRP